MVIGLSYFRLSIELFKLIVVGFVIFSFAFGFGGIFGLVICCDFVPKTTLAAGVIGCLFLKTAFAAAVNGLSVGFAIVSFTGPINAYLGFTPTGGFSGAALLINVIGLVFFTVVCFTRGISISAFIELRIDDTDGGLLIIS